MRIPITSETDAYRVAIGLAALAGVAIAVRFVTSPVVGLLVFAAGILLVVVIDVVRPEPDRLLPLREAARSRHRDTAADRRHVLVIANEALRGDELRRALRRNGTSVELDVLAPILTSRSHFLTGDYDAELDEARKRLEESLAWTSREGFEATGKVGDPSPVAAVGDELRRFGADEVVIVTHSRERSNWLERRLLDQARRELDCVVTQVITDVRDGTGTATSGVYRAL